MAVRQALIDPSPDCLIDNWGGSRYKELPVPGKELILKFTRVLNKVVMLKTLWSGRVDMMMVKSPI